MIQVELGKLLRTQIYYRFFRKFRKLRFCVYIYIYIYILHLLL